MTCKLICENSTGQTCQAWNRLGPKEYGIEVTNFGERVECYIYLTDITLGSEIPLNLPIPALPAGTFETQ
jgi:hypothetical protein